MRTKRWQPSWISLVLMAGVLVFSGLTAISVFAFVPTSEEELEQGYRPILRSDLSACGREKRMAQVGTRADAAEFGSRLHGMWALRQFTVDGVTVEEMPRSAQLYFDIKLTGTSGTGSALFIEHDRPQLQLASTRRSGGDAAFWTIVIGQPDMRSVSLVMKGDARSGLALSTQKASFSGLHNMFVAIDATGPENSDWDRIVLSERSLTYVSCKRNVVQRYTKMSNAKPRIDGMTLSAYWQQLSKKQLEARAHRHTAARH